MKWGSYSNREQRNGSVSVRRLSVVDPIYRVTELFDTKFTCRLHSLRNRKGKTPNILPQTDS